MSQYFEVPGNNKIAKYEWMIDNSMMIGYRNHPTLRNIKDTDANIIRKLALDESSTYTVIACVDNGSFCAYAKVLSNADVDASLCVL